MKQPPQEGVLCQTLYNKHKHNNHSSFCGKHIILGALLLFSIAHTINVCFFVSVY